MTTYKKHRGLGISESFNGYVAIQYQQGVLNVIGLPERNIRPKIDTRPYIGGETYKIDRLKMQQVMDAINEVLK
jgi:hypothetical protein